MTSIKEKLQLLIQALEGNGVSHARQEAERLLSYILNRAPSSLYLEKEYFLSEEEEKRCEEHLLRRLQGEPLAYIQGEVEFYHCRFQVNRSVLIPRQETELLVDHIARTLAQQELAGKVLWDLCSGSGCIGISLKKAFPELLVILSDLMPDALEVARSNAEKNRVQVDLKEGDLLEPFRGQKSHFVVVNPPYVSKEEYQGLQIEVRGYEPASALIGGASGLEFYERLSKELPAYLFPGATVWFEIGYRQGEVIQKLFNRKPWKNQRLLTDWSGQTRFFFLESE